jgi:hypothetical protein
MWDGELRRSVVPGRSQSSIWEPLDLNSWKEDQKAFRSNPLASGLIKGGEGEGEEVAFGPDSAAGAFLCCLRGGR